MPGYPVNVACQRFSNSTDKLEILASVKRGIDVYYNYTGTAGTCYNITSSGPSTLEDDGGWDYQSCTEMVIHIYHALSFRLLMHQLFLLCR
jgi:lysosomal Pro-X carboxypeptidase